MRTEDRLVFIRQDVARLLSALPQEVLNLPIEGYEDVVTVLNNIAIASDLNDKEPERWTKVWWEAYCNDDEGGTHTVASFDTEAEAIEYTSLHNACWYDRWSMFNGEIFKS